MKPYIAEMNHKMFVIEMQAKGKIPKLYNDAMERKEKDNQGTGKRIFPGPWGQDAVLDKLLDQSAANIQSAQHAVQRGAPSSTAAAAGPSTAASGTPSTSQQQPQKKRHDPAQRQMLKAKLKALEGELEAERTARKQAEAAIAELAQRHKEQQQTAGGSAAGPQA